VLDDGTVLYDSPVICEYLDSLDGKPKLFPTEPKARLVALRRQAFGDGFLDLLLLARNEGERPQPSDVHLKSAAARKAAVLNSLEQEAMALGFDAARHRHIAIGCALSYLDFRFSPARTGEKVTPHCQLALCVRLAAFDARDRAGRRFLIGLGQALIPASDRVRFCLALAVFDHAVRFPRRATAAEHARSAE